MWFDKLDRYDYLNTVSISIGLVMRAVTVSPKFQVVIPKDVRESMGRVQGVCGRARSIIPVGESPTLAR